MARGEMGDAHCAPRAGLLRFFATERSGRACAGGGRTADEKYVGG